MFYQVSSHSAESWEGRGLTFFIKIPKSLNACNLLDQCCARGSIGTGLVGLCSVVSAPQPTIEVISCKMIT